MVILTQEILRRLVHYDPLTGLFTRLIRTSNRIRTGESTAGSPRGAYLVLCIGGRQYPVHRLAWLYMTGEWPPKIDHEDLDGINNKWANLRLATESQNKANVARSATNTSGFKGVSFHKATNKWCARIKVEQRPIWLGLHDTVEAAHAAYCAAAREHFGEFARFE